MAPLAKKKKNGGGGSEVKGSAFLLQVIAALQGQTAKKHNKRIRFDYTFENKQHRYQRRILRTCSKLTHGRHMVN